MVPRVITGLLFFAVLLFGLFSRQPWASLLIFALVFGATFLGTREYYQLARRKQLRPSPWPEHLVALAFLVDAYFYEFHHFVHLFITCFWLLLITQVFFKRYDRAVPNTAVSLFGSIYVGLPMAILLYIFQCPQKWGYEVPHAGGNLIIFLIVTCWATDIGGYCFGKTLGKHKMSPVLSPNKTYEGLAGGAALALVSGILLKVLWPGLGEMLHWGEAIGLPMLFTLLGTVGDLAESSFKRDAGVKDSGKTYTGHGGMLDILDSLLLCAPVFFLYLEWTR